MEMRLKETPSRDKRNEINRENPVSIQNQKIDDIDRAYELIIYALSKMEIDQNEKEDIKNRFKRIYLEKRAEAFFDEKLELFGEVLDILTRDLMEKNDDSITTLHYYNHSRRFTI